MPSAPAPESAISEDFRHNCAPDTSRGKPALLPFSAHGVHRRKDTDTSWHQNKPYGRPVQEHAPIPKAPAPGTPGSRPHCG